MQPRTLPLLAALCAFLAIAFGAFGAHMIADPQAKAWAQTGTAYLLPHAVAVFALLGWRQAKGLPLAAAMLLLGAAVFAFSLYGLALGMPRFLGMVAPVGGTLMMLGWLMAGWALLRR